jgi:hypothetical protein
MVGLDVVPYGSKIKFKGKYFTTCSERVKFIPGEMKSGVILNTVSCLSNDFKNVEMYARERFGKVSGVTNHASAMSAPVKTSTVSEFFLLI